MDTNDKQHNESRKALIEFPISFMLKLVVSSEYPEDETKDRINDIFNDCMVANIFENVRASSKGSYLSYSYTVVFLDQNHLNETYEALKKLPGLKFAV